MYLPCMLFDSNIIILEKIVFQNKYLASEYTKQLVRNQYLIISKNYLIITVPTKNDILVDSFRIMIYHDVYKNVIFPAVYGLLYLEMK